ncbi:hypothetical protein FS842_011134 [Serendipita sp. 407]|nr:hypothetical protein FS842_011134 [Serendipita sp. 407]
MPQDIAENEPLLKKTDGSRVLVREISSSSADTQRASETRGRPKTPSTPLPLKQLFVLGLVRLAEPINFTLIFPFVNQMMVDLKVTEESSEIGFYSGLVDSCFAVAQCCTILQWGRLSDRVGRRPVIFIGLLGSIISVFFFGHSKNLAWALTSRSIAGALSGNVAVVQSILSEITDSTNEAKAMPLNSLTWNLGCIIGPIIGGNLLYPAKRWPNTPLDNAWFREFPYALPCAVGASIGLAALTLAYTSLQETRWKKHTLKSNVVTVIASREASHNPNPSQVESLRSTPKKTTVRDILAYPPLRDTIMAGFLQSILATGYDVVFALVCFSPISLGGFSRSPAEIGYAFAFGGLLSLLILPFGLPSLQRRYGTVSLYYGLSMFWPFIYLMFPLLNMIVRHFVIDEENCTLSIEGTYVLWTGIAVLILMTRITSMSFSLNIMLVKAAAPDKEMLGSTFGVSQTIACIARAIGPILASSLFAASVDRQILGGNAVWLVMASIGLWGFLQARSLYCHNL